MAKIIAWGLIVICAGALALVAIAGIVLIAAASLTTSTNANTQGTGQPNGHTISISTGGIKIRPIDSNDGKSGFSDRDSATAVNSVDSSASRVQVRDQDNDDNDAAEKSPEQSAETIFHSLMNTSVTIESVDNAIVEVNSLLALSPHSMKANMISLQLRDMKCQMLASAGKTGKDVDTAILESAKIAKRMHGMDELPDRIRFRFAKYVYREAEVHAGRGELADCVAALEEAAKMGYGEIQNAMSDSAFAAFQSDDGFSSRVRELEQEVSLQIKKQVQASLDAFESFPFEFSLQGTGDDKLELVKYRGKLLVIDLIGSWCPPCIEELPILQKLQESYPKERVEFLCMAWERDGGRKQQTERIDRLFSQRGVTLEYVLIESQFSKKIPNFRGYPTKLLIDSAGKVRLHWTGKQSEKRLKTAIDLLLKKSHSRTI